MSRIEDVDNTIWDDPDWNALTPTAKLLYFWSFTNQKCNWAGLYRVSKPIMAFETGYTVEELDPIIVELDAARFLFYDGTWLWVRSRVKRIRSKTIPMCINVVKALKTVPDSHPYMLQVLEAEGDRVWQSKVGEAETRTTIRAQMGYVPGGTPDTPGSYGAVPSLEGKTESHSGTTTVVLGKGTGKGRGPSRGRGAGKGWRSPVPAPSPAAVVQRSERQQREEALYAHFPNVDALTVRSAASCIQRRGETATVEAIRLELEAA